MSQSGRLQRPAGRVRAPAEVGSAAGPRLPGGVLEAPAGKRGRRVLQLLEGDAGLLSTTGPSR